MPYGGAATLPPFAMTMQFNYAPDPAADQLLSLYLEHADSARILAKSLLLDSGEAEDVVQDVFLTLWRRPTCFDPERGTGRAWLLTVVRNRSLDHLRRRSPRADIADFIERLPDPHPTDVNEALATDAEAEVLWGLVGALPKCQADVIRRAFVSGQTHQQIADETGLPLGTVKSRIRLGIEKLRSALLTCDGARQFV